MNNEDRIAIEGVFSRLQEVERQGGPREPEAEQFIRSRIDAQPGAAYYLAQTVLVQEHALKTAQQKIAELEQRVATPAPAAPQEGFAANAARQSGLTVGYFGRSAPASQQASPPPSASGAPLSAAGTPLSAAGTPLSAAGTPLQGGMPPASSQFGQSGQAGQGQAAPAQAAPGRAGGFLAGAAQTAMGVAGGMMLGSLLGGMFGGGAAHAGAKPAEPAPEAKPEPTADAGSQAQDNATSDAQFDPPNDSANNAANNAPSDTSDYASTDVAYDNSDSGFGFFDDGGDFDDV